MATIQIRNIPEDVYESIRRRAREAGQSLQAYMRARVIEDERSRARRSEILEDYWAQLDADPPDITREQIVADVHAMREERDRR